MSKRTDAGKLVAGARQARTENGPLTRQPDPVVRAYTAARIREFLGLPTGKGKS